MEGYISIKEIIDNCLDHPLLQDLTFERAIKYAVEFIRIVGCPKLFLEKTEKLEIKDYRAQLPCDFCSMIQVRLLIKNGYSRAFIYASDSFHMSDEKSTDLGTYKILGGVIFTSLLNGTVEIAYKAIATDEDGYPLVPDNAAFTRALELYIKKLRFTILFDLSKINQQVYNNVQLEYSWAVGQALNELIKPSIDELLAITNAWNTMIPRMKDHSSGFRNHGTPEVIKIV